MDDQKPAVVRPMSRRSEKLRILDLIEQYKTAGKFEKVLEAIKGEISPNTLNNWLKDKEGAERAYKADALLRIKERLPSLEDIKKLRRLHLRPGRNGT